MTTGRVWADVTVPHGGALYNLLANMTHILFYNKENPLEAMLEWAHNEPWFEEMTLSSGDKLPYLVQFGWKHNWNVIYSWYEHYDLTEAVAGALWLTLTRLSEMGEGDE